ncbi:MAG: hypothetical protein QM723_27600 [Myxococcaceae bacterium]
MLVRICDLISIVREIELPEQCPECGEKLDRVNETNMTDAFIDGTLTVPAPGEVAEFLPTDSWEYGETFIVVGFRCAHCSHVLVEGDFVERRNS